LLNKLHYDDKRSIIFTVTVHNFLLETSVALFWARQDTKTRTCSTACILSHNYCHWRLSSAEALTHLRSVGSDDINSPLHRFPSPWIT